MANNRDLLKGFPSQPARHLDAAAIHLGLASGAAPHGLSRCGPEEFREGAAPRALSPSRVIVERPGNFGNRLPPNNTDESLKPGRDLCVTRA